MTNGDDRQQRRMERERLIPPEVLRAAAHDVYLHAAAHRYVEGDGEAWAACFDALRAECARLAGECERMGLPAMALDVGAWPETGWIFRGAAEARAVGFAECCQAQGLSESIASHMLPRLHYSIIRRSRGRLPAQFNAPGLRGGRPFTHSP